MTSLVLPEPISPELALVCPELRSRALEEEERKARELEAQVDVAALRRLFEPKETEEPPAERRLAVQLAAYAALQVGVGLVVGFAAVASVTLTLMALTLLAR
jgi:hypothetical protein